MSTASNPLDDLAIRAEGLGKRYYLGTIEKYQTLREAISRKVGVASREVFDGLARLAGLPYRAERDPAEYIWALRGVDLILRRGEVLGVIGPNGGGKSTLLKILSRVTHPTEGWFEARGRVGALLEVGTGFHPELTGRENVYLNGGIMGLDRKAVDGRLDEIVDFSGVGRFIDVPLKRYSTGMRMRLAFSVAVFVESEILLVDEVLAVGDLEFQQKSLAKMREFVAGGRSVVFVSHSLGIIEEFCGRVLWLDHGRPRMEGAAREVVEAYVKATTPA